MKKVLTIVLFIAVLDHANAQPEDYNDWSYSRNLHLNTTVTGANVPGEVTNFPLLIRLDNSNFDFSQAKSDGTDIRFAKSDGSHLSFELERWDNSGELAEFWVLCDTIYGNNKSQSINIYWGKSDAADSSDAETVFASMNGFAGIWHLSEDPSGTIYDATSNNNDGTSNGGMNSTDLVTATVGEGLDFLGGGSGQYLDVGNDASLSFSQNFTLSTWINIDTDQPAAEWPTIIGKGNENSNGWRLYQNQNGHNIEFSYADAALGNPHYGIVSASSIQLDSSYHMVFSFNTSGTLAKIYINGEEVDSSTDVEEMMSNSDNLFIADEVSNGRFDGILDEVRISTTVRSDDWIRLCYENQQLSQTLVDYEDYNDWNNSTNITFNTTATGANVSGDVANFPLLIRLDNGNFDFTQAKPDGTDIRFAKSDGSHLSFELERWDNSGELAEIWVLCDTIYGDNDSQYITMYWGKSDASSVSDPETVFASTNGFAGIWHLSEDPSGTIYDATTNNNDGTSNGGMNSTDLVTATVGEGLDFLGGASGQYLDMGSDASLNFNQNLTASFWINIDNNSLSSQWPTVIGKGNENYDGWRIYVDENSHILTFGYNDSTGTPHWILALFNLSLDTWHHVAVSYNYSGTIAKMYLDGDTEVAVNTTEINQLMTNSLGLMIADEEYNGSFDGMLDEVRVSGVARSDDWIKLSYENQRLAQTLLSMDFPLPVELLNFSGAVSGKAIKLEWQTASEINNSHFIVERSEDGKTFHALDKVEGHGSTDSFVSYQIFDEKPLADINYYRLKQVDFDGKKEYSRTIYTIFNQRSHLSVFPNPTSDEFTIQLNTYENELALRLLTLSRVVVFEKKIVKTDLVLDESIRVDHLPRGLYILEVKGKQLLEYAYLIISDK